MCALGGTLGLCRTLMPRSAFKADIKRLSAASATRGMQMVESVATVSRGQRDRPDRSKFFAISSTTMLLIVLIAFSRTFYFRPFIEATDLTAQLGQRALPWHVVIHGSVLTLWFMIFCCQTWLVASRRIYWHRRLGWYGIAVSVAVSVSAISTVLLFPARGLDGGFPLEAVTGIVVGDSLFQLLFICLVSLAVYWRHRAEVHRRLMYFAAIAIIGPAFSSGNQRPFGTLLEQVLPASLPFSNFLIGLWSAVFALLAFDFLSAKRMYVATMGPAILFTLAEVFAANSGTIGWGQRLVAWLA